MAESQFTKRKIKFFVVTLILVAVLAVAAGVGIHFYIGHYFEASDISDSLSDQLNICSSFTVDDILESEKYSYGWMKSSIDVEVLMRNPEFDEKAEDSEEDEYIVTQDILDYDAKTRTFTVCGIGSGIIDFRNPLDASVSLQVPFSTKFVIDDTILILKENYPEFFEDGLISKDEIESIDELRLTAPRSYNVGEFFMCPNLYRIVLSSEVLLQLDGVEKIDEGIIFYVNDGLYGDYMSSSHWTNYRERIFPVVDLSTGKHALVFEFRGGRMAATGAEATHYFSSVENGETINLDNFIVERTGYTFLGWFTSNDNGITLTQTRIYEDYIFQADTKLYADWSANEYEIIYHDAYVTELPNSQKIKYDQQSAISDAILERIGYTFIGWSLTESSTAIAYIPGQSIMNLATEDGVKINLYAVWAANAYTIIYDGNGTGVTNIPTRQSDILFDTEINLSNEIPVWTGHTFIGWSTNKNATDYEYERGQTVRNLVSNSDGQVILYAVWSTNTYSIRYDANGGADAPSNQENLVYGESVKLSSVIPIWAGRVFLGWSRNQNATTASWQAGASVSSLVSDAGGVVTLYAVWTYDSFRIQYDPNGGENAPANSSYIYYNSTSARITASKPTRTGYTFVGWAYSTDGNIDFASDQELTQSEINEMYGRASGSPKLITLYARWSINSYKITIKSSGDKGGSITGVTDGGYYEYNTRLTIRISYNGPKSSYLYFDGANMGEKSSYTFNMPAKDITLEVHSNSCIATGTLITLADGTLKKVEELNGTETILSWDFYTGKLIKTKIALLNKHGDAEYQVVNLLFEDGDQIKIIASHGFMDATLNDFVYIDETNYKDYIGHQFIKIDTSSSQQYYTTKLVSAYVTTEYTGAYSVWAANGLTCVTNNMLSVGPHGYAFGFGLFVINDDMKYDEKSMAEAIEKYGLYSYEEWSNCLTYEQFMAFNGQYAKIAVGLGLITEDELVALIKRTVGKE